jgi:DNA-binding response OmpR family regulator
LPAANAAHERNAGKGDLEVSKAVRVLVVEDEALICSFIEDALSDGGFEACSVQSGEAALSTFRDGREQCRALLTDVNLGDGISGWELARQIREITPGFPVVYMTSATGNRKASTAAS